MSNDFQDRKRPTHHFHCRLACGVGRGKASLLHERLVRHDGGKLLKGHRVRLDTGRRRASRRMPLLLVEQGQNEARVCEEAGKLSKKMLRLRRREAALAGKQSLTEQKEMGEGPHEEILIVGKLVDGRSLALNSKRRIHVCRRRPCRRRHGVHRRGRRASRDDHPLDHGTR